MSRGIGFKVTLVEVIAIVILALVLIGLMIPAVTCSREPARRAECTDHLRQIGMALAQYARDHGGDFPATPDVVKSMANVPGSAPAGSGRESLGLLYDFYVPDIRVFWCPSEPPAMLTAEPASGGRNLFFRDNDTCSYAYDPRHYSGNKPGIALVADKGGGKGINSPNHYDGQIVLYLDGRARWETSTDCGYDDDEIYVRNNYADPRDDSCLIE